MHSKERAAEDCFCKLDTPYDYAGVDPLPRRVSGRVKGGHYGGDRHRDQHRPLRPGYAAVSILTIIESHCIPGKRFLNLYRIFFLSNL